MSFHVLGTIERNCSSKSDEIETINALKMTIASEQGYFMAHSKGGDPDVIKRDIVPFSSKFE